jgi:hypothetical protein
MSRYLWAQLIPRGLLEFKVVRVELRLLQTMADRALLLLAHTRSYSYPMPCPYPLPCPYPPTPYPHPHPHPVTFRKPPLRPVQLVLAPLPAPSRPVYPLGQSLRRRLRERPQERIAPPEAMGRAQGVGRVDPGALQVSVQRTLPCSPPRTDLVAVGRCSIDCWYAYLATNT